MDFIPTASSERAETAPLQTYKNNSTFIDKYKGSNQARLQARFCQEEVSSFPQILDISNTSIYQLMVSQMQDFSARNIREREREKLYLSQDHNTYK